jgi:NAD(P)H dehydrogenase (quinone)
MRTPRQSWVGLYPAGVGIVVTGASGKVGRLVASRLAEGGHEQTLIVRDPGRAPALEGARVVAADFRDPASLRRALAPGDRVFMVSVHEGVEQRLAAHRGFLEAAAAARVGLVAYLSIVNASRQSAFPHSWSHAATEELIRASGLPFVFLRMNLFLDDLSLWFDADGVCRGPGGDGRVALVTRRDVAAVAAAVLTDPSHDGEALDVSGEEALDLAELAAICRAASGRDLRYEPGTREGYVATRIALGRRQWDAEAGAGCYVAVAHGEFDVESDVVRRIGGVEPDLPRAWADANGDRFAVTGDREHHRPG